MGTPEFAVPSLRAVARRCDVRVVVTRPDRSKGRGRKNAPSEVALAAESLGLEVVKPESINDAEVVAALRERAPDLFAVVAFGGILSPETLAVPRIGSLNLHGSMLPEYRGASPVQRALWDGRSSTGVSTMWIDEGLDTGDVVLQRWAPIEPGDDAGSLASRLAELGAPLLAESLVLASNGRATRRPQSTGRATYAPKLRKEHGCIDWTLDAVSVWNRQRAVTPWPGATTAHGRKQVRIERCEPEHMLALDQAPGTLIEIREHGVVVACGRGALRLIAVLPESRRSMDAGEWARGARLAPGAVLGGAGADE
jgi:methionyl-tRNA formyltransferase